MARPRPARTGVLALLCAAALSLLAAAAAAAADPRGDAAAAMYSPDTVVAIHLTLPPASVQALEEHPEDEYVEGTFSLAETNGSPSGVGPFSAPIKVGIRLKGGKFGSFRPLGGKAAFKIKFSFVKGQRFLGLKKMTLNNMVQDESMVAESLAYRAFRALGVPSPRSGYAYLTVNGADYGVYLNIEDLDDVALEKRFGKFDDPQHLYEGEYGVDVEPGAEEIGEEAAFQVDEGDDGEVEDLEELILAANDGAAPDWSDHIAPFADLAEMTKMWATEKYVGHWDGYSGEEGSLLPNNYYLYSSAAGRFQMLPWGTDQTWGRRLPFDGDAGLLFDECLADDSCEGEYEAALGSAMSSVNALDLSSAARCTALLLAPWQALETPPRRPYTASQTTSRVAAVRNFAETRPAEVAAWLGVAAPAVPAAQPCAGEPPAPAPPLAAAPPAPLPSLRLGRIAVKKGVLTAHLLAPAAGTAKLEVTSRFRGGIGSVCRSERATPAAGPLTLACSFPRAFRNRLEAHSRWLRVSAGFASTVGKAEAAARSVRVAAAAAASSRR
ncbi:MAG: CotH kinase family protein [Solirubrobacterales bacterium]